LDDNPVVFVALITLMLRPRRRPVRNPLSPTLVPRWVQIMVKNTCGHASVQLGMAAIEKLDRLRAGKARIAERRAS
jgi:hypothetical protein